MEKFLLRTYILLITEAINLIHHLLLLMSSLNTSQLELLREVIDKKLKAEEARPLAKPITGDEQELANLDLVQMHQQHTAAHDRIWEAIERLEDRVDTSGEKPKQEHQIVIKSQEVF
jgi:uncharacterized membrane protein YccC